mmetsp:Transcript_35507/g.104976  ORF Transcript_35507/g.104976 Transcript_35507/m.104976 type:complete len:368 (-) Transcript_35507:56-1159(-)
MDTPGLHRMRMSHAEVERQRRQEVEELDAPTSNAVQRTCGWRYSGMAPLGVSPSERDGLDPAKVDKWRREFLHLIYKAGTALKIPPWGLATAALLCHRFFSIKSMKRNDRFVIATASLHLAAKIQEAPKSIRDVVRECDRTRHAGNEQMQRLLSGEPAYADAELAYLNGAKEQILMAERALLYTLGFDLNIEYPHRFLLKFLADLDSMPGGGKLDECLPGTRELFQSAWNLMNDSFRTTLCLQFPEHKVAAAVIYMANEVNKRRYGKGIEQVIVEKTGDTSATFFSYFGISPEEVKEISGQVLELYAQSMASTLRESGDHAAEGVTAGGMEATLRPGAAHGAADGSLKRKLEERADAGGSKVPHLAS